VFTITLTPIDHTITCGTDDTVLTAILRSGASVMWGRVWHLQDAPHVRQRRARALFRCRAA
jgi:hypothetical protein